jgi:heterogeneous nuclear ribonucleoprotein G
MNNKIFVGNLAWSVRDKELYEAFSKFGDVEECVVILERNTGRSRGFGFVTYADSGAAERAVEEMHGTKFGDTENPREINVSLAQSKGRADTAHNHSGHHHETRAAA